MGEAGSIQNKACDSNKQKDKICDWKPDYALSTEAAKHWQELSQERRKLPLTPDCKGTYKVVYGDSLWTIAERTLRTQSGNQPDNQKIQSEVDAYVRLNDGKYKSLDCNKDYILPGWVLKVPGAADNCPPKVAPPIEKPCPPKETVPVPVETPALPPARVITPDNDLYSIELPVSQNMVVRNIDHNSRTVVNNINGDNNSIVNNIDNSQNIVLNGSINRNIYVYDGAYGRGGGCGGCGGCGSCGGRQWNMQYREPVYPQMYQQPEYPPVYYDRMPIVRTPQFYDPMPIVRPPAYWQQPGATWSWQNPPEPGYRPRPYAVPNNWRANVY